MLRAHGHDLRLLHPQVFLPLQGVLHHLLILPPVGLSPQGPHRRSLPPVEHPVLDTGPIGGPAHLAPKGVQLPHQMALPRAADGGVAGHVAHRIQIHRKAQGAQPQTGGGEGRLDARVAGPNDRNIKSSCVVFSHTQIPNLFSPAARGPGDFQNARDE